jgi:L-lactate dehydrogenase (FMN-dependent) and related alpha-hydroxy acid dehydrogenases
VKVAGEIYFISIDLYQYDINLCERIRVSQANQKRKAMSTPINLHEYEQLARERLPEIVYEYYAGGAADELTLTENQLAWGRLRLRPRVLVDVSHVDPSTTVLGQLLSMPVLTAPCAFNALAHPEGECAVARATASAGIIQIVSTLSTHSLEEVAVAAPGPRWFQLYCYRDRGVTRALVERAEAAGYTALCITVDVPVAGQRERDMRNHFQLPPGMNCKNLVPVGLDRLEAVAEGSALQKYINDLWDNSLTWEAVDWLRSLTRLPVLVKGVLTAEDAQLAIECGVAGIVVSNHGGRQLDGAISTCAALLEVVQAVAGRAEVLVDGGIRRGTDVLKALALGARAVLIGRPYLWGLAVGGEAGVRHVLELLRRELEPAMALSGRPTVASIDRTLVERE